MIIIHAFHLDFNTKTSINQRTSIIQDEEIEDNNNIYDYIEEEPDKQDDANQSISQEELSLILTKKTHSQIYNIYIICKSNLN